MLPKHNKIKEMLLSRGIDGAIVSSPENFHYAAGFAGHQHTVSRQPGFTLAVLGADAAAPSYAVTMDFEVPAFQEKNSPFIIKKYDTWVGVKQWEEIAGGVLYPDPSAMESSMDVLLRTVGELGLSNKTLGVELSYLPADYYQALKNKLPEAAFVDISELFVYARSVKTQEEIQMFRSLCRVADDAFTEVSKIVSVGVLEREMSECFKRNVIASGICAPSAWSMFSTGSNGARLGLPGDREIARGDVVKFDGGVNAAFDFYTTDTSRGWVMEGADTELLKLKDRLYEAQRRMIGAAKPGMPMCELFDIGFSYVKQAYPAYRRGHLGHSISMGPATAEAPYINPTEARVLEPGMVLAIEVPCYILGVGGFNIEDMVLITENGSEILTPRTPHYL